MSGNQILFYFEKTIIPSQDNTVSIMAKETIYKKYDNSNEYILRRGGKLRPALYPNKCASNNQYGTKSWYYGYGRNYLYVKDVQMPVWSGILNNNFNNYVKLGVPPTYPSIGYESIYKVNGEYSEMGDLLYNLVHPRYLGQVSKLRSGYFGDILTGCTCNGDLPSIRYSSGDTMDIQEFLNERYNSTSGQARKFLKYFQEGYSMYIPDWRYSEYKWFDKSQIVNYPKEYNFWVDVYNNDFNKLKEGCIDKLYKDLKDIEGVDKIYIWNIYDFKYDLQYAQQRIVNGEKVDIFTYKVKAFLK